MKKLLAILLVAVLALGALAACTPDAPPTPAAEPVTVDEAPAPEPTPEPEVEEVEEVADAVPFRVALSLPPILNDFHATMVREFEGAIEYYAGRMDITIYPGGDTPDGAAQVNALEQIVLGNYDGVIISAWDGNMVGPIAEELYNSGIPVVVVNRMIDPEVFTTFVAGDNPGGARLMGYYIGEAVAHLEEANVFVFRMVAGTPIDYDRQQAIPVLESFPNIRIIGEAEGSNNAETGYESAMNAMAAHDRIDVIYGHDEFAARGAIQAFKDAGRYDELILATGFSGTQLLLSEFEENPDWKLRVAAYLPVMGATAVHAMWDILNGEDVPRYVIDPPMVLGPHNMEEWAHLAF